MIHDFICHVDRYIRMKKTLFILPLCCVQPGALNPFAAPNIDIGRSHHKSLHMSWCRASPKWTLLLESRKEKICGDFPKISEKEGIPEVFQQQKNWASNSWLSWPWSSTSFFKHLSLSQKSQESPSTAITNLDHKSAPRFQPFSHGLVIGMIGRWQNHTLTKHIKISCNIR